MTPGLATKLERMRMALSADPNGVVAGDLGSGLVSEPNVGSRTYAAFLSACNGGRFGGVDLWRADELDGQQFYIDDEVPGGAARWLCIGRITTDLLLLDRKTDEVHLFPPPYARPNPNGTRLGVFDSFLDEILLGRQYMAVVGDSPAEWIDHLQRLGFVPPDARPPRG